MISLQSHNQHTKNVEYIFNLCKFSPHIQTNLDYKRKAQNTKIEVSDTTDVNAYAQSINNGHKIVMFEGIMNMMQLFGYALAEFKHTNDYDNLHRAFHLIIDKWIEDEYEFDGMLVKELAATLGYDSASSYIEGEATAYFTGLALTVIAHEMGHIALSHTMREDGTYTTSRNDERMADLFAQSVISTTPFASYMILSGLFMPIMLVWLHKGEDGTEKATTHPHARERVMNALASNDEYLEELGITEDNISDFLP